MSSREPAGQVTGDATTPGTIPPRPLGVVAPPEKVIGWDVVTWARALPLFERVVGPDLTGKTGLEIGASEGGLSLWLALKGGEVVCSFHGGDPRRATALHKQFGVHDHVRYEYLDATRIPYRDRFDVIALKSVIGGIGAGGRRDLRYRAIEQIRAALKDDGLFLFAENLVATRVHMRLRALKRGNNWRYLTVDELRSMLRRFSSLDYFTTGFIACLGRSEAQRRVLGRVDGVACRMVPRKWRYVMVGAARK